MKQFSLSPYLLVGYPPRIIPAHKALWAAETAQSFRLNRPRRCESQQCSLLQKCYTISLYVHRKLLFTDYNAALQWSHPDPFSYKWGRLSIANISLEQCQFKKKNYILQFTNGSFTISSIFYRWSCYITCLTLKLTGHIRKVSDAADPRKAPLHTDRCPASYLPTVSIATTVSDCLMV